MELGVFSKSKGERHPSGKTSREIVCTLGHGMHVTGNIVFEGSLQIFGRVVGDIHASHLVICEGAQVEGNVIAQETIIDGVFQGTIYCDSVKLHSKAVVYGEIYNNSLAIEQNAQFEGVSRRLEQPIDSPASAQANPPPSPAMAAVPATGAAA